MLVEVMDAGPGTFPSNDNAPPTVHSSIPPIFHSVVAATRKTSSDLRPPFAHFLHQPLDQLALFRTDGGVIESGLEVLMEAFSTLLGGPSLQELCYPDPVVGAMCVDEAQECCVLSLRPWSPLVVGHI